MPLPLLLAAGAGILSGGRYLMNKADQQDAQENVQGMQNFLQTSNLAAQRPDIAQHFMNIGQQQTDGGSIFGNMGSAQKTQSLFDAAQQAEIILNTQNKQAQQAQAMAAEQAASPFSPDNMDYAKQLGDEWDRNNREIAAIQQQFQSAQIALDNPSNLNSITTLYNLMNIIEPGGKVTPNETGVFTGTGDTGNRFANLLNEWQGKGLTDTTRAEIEQAIWGQYTPKYEAAVRRKTAMEKRIADMAKQGRNVTSPVGRLGIDYDLDQRGAAPGGRSNRPIGVPDGYEVVE